MIVTPIKTRIHYYLILLFIIFFSLQNIHAQEHNYPKRTTVNAVIDSVYVSPCHYETLYLSFKIEDTSTIKDSIVWTQGLRGYQFSSSYLNKIYSEYQDNTLRKKKDVLLGLYFDNKSSAPVLEWVSEPSRAESILNLRDFLIKEEVYKVEVSQNKPTAKPKIETGVRFPCNGKLQVSFYPSLMYENAGQFLYTKNNKTMIAIENPLGSGKWSSKNYNYKN
ncbi:hypothetical protein [Formosa algae]|uniref:hypothetical protein n=1 Tax=Formosa algae TaxID=225843 RepID=UPI000CCE6766|nr:hypothetical protein [Formosa algae]PNW28718.1 hypothetical protein BKP44_07315 [Formosa algae]